MQLPEYAIQGYVNAFDLSNGRYTNRFRTFAMNNPDDVTRWRGILDWMGKYGVPTANAEFFTVPSQLGVGSGFGPTMMRFEMPPALPEDPAKYADIDVVMTFNDPATALWGLRVAFNLPGAGQEMVYYPGTSLFRQQYGPSPIGEPIPSLNTPGWTREFARYYEKTAAYVKGVTFDPFVTSDGQEYRSASIRGAANPGGPFAGSQTLEVWERVR